MKIDHIAIWAEDIELLRAFYTKYFNMECGTKYVKPIKKFTSYFLSFGGEKARIELKHIPDMQSPACRSNLRGLAHFSIALGSCEAVDLLTDGNTILSAPRIAGDGYYESVIADPEGNHVEITA